MNFVTYGSAALLLILSLNAHAQNRQNRVRVPGTTTTTAVAEGESKTRISEPNPQLEWIKQRLTVGGFISTSSTLSSEGFSSRAVNSTTGPVDRGSVDFSSSSALGLQAQIIEMRTPNWGWFANASVEQSREISSTLVKVGGNTYSGNFRNKPRFTPWIISGGGVYRFNDKVYALAGVNYTLYKDIGEGEFRNLSLDPKLGLQYGLGFQPVERVSLELIQREVKYDFSGNIGNTRVTADDLRLAGLNLVARYSFQ